jgi:thiol-disulfide isomerase/thioredoxin
MTPNSNSSNPGRRRILLAAAALALVLAAVLYGIGRVARKEATADADCPAASAIAQKLAPLARGQVAALDLTSPPHPFPDVSFQGPDGLPRHLTDFHGRTVLLNLWATWCVPCRQEMPALDKLQAQLGGPKFEVVAVSVDTVRLERRQAFLREAGVRSLRFYADPTAQILRALKESGPLVGLPTSFLIAPDGCQLGVMSGPANWASQDADALISTVTKAFAKG